jgi:hypothetical protein
MAAKGTTRSERMEKRAQREIRCVGNVWTGIDQDSVKIKDDRIYQVFHNKIPCCTCLNLVNAPQNCQVGSESCPELA